MSVCSNSEITAFSRTWPRVLDESHRVAPLRRCRPGIVEAHRIAAVRKQVAIFSARCPILGSSRRWRRVQVLVHLTLDPRQLVTCSIEWTGGNVRLWSAMPRLMAGGSTTWRTSRT